LAVPYRSTIVAARRQLVVQNAPRATALSAFAMGTAFLVTGAILLPLAYAGLLLPGAEVLFSAMGTVMLIAGAAMTALAAHMLRSRTVFALEREELTITTPSDEGDTRRYVVSLADVQHVGLDGGGGNHAANYCVRIGLRGTRVILLGGARTSFRRHHERVAAEIRQFLSFA
jgi:hypothetical protein